MTLDRKDGNLGYFKTNCQWATKKEQRANQRTSFVEFDVAPVNEIPY
jgi:hypothetical protein